MLIEAGTHLIFDAIIVFILDGGAGKGFKIIALCQTRNATNVGRPEYIPLPWSTRLWLLGVTIWAESRKSVKFIAEEPLADGSYLRSDLSPG